MGFQCSLDGFVLRWTALERQFTLCYQISNTEHRLIVVCGVATNVRSNWIFVRRLPGGLFILPFCFRIHHLRCVSLHRQKVENPLLEFRRFEPKQVAFVKIGFIFGGEVVELHNQTIQDIYRRFGLGAGLESGKKVVWTGAFDDAERMALEAAEPGRKILDRVVVCL